MPTSWWARIEEQRCSSPRGIRLSRAFDDAALVHRPGRCRARWQLVLVAEPTRVAVPCPKCGQLSRRQHSSDLRRLLDLPWRGHAVRLRVHSRRWFCDVPACPRRIFAERFDGVLARYARRTDEATELLTVFALQAGGDGGARLAHKAGVPTSPDTLLRLLQIMSDPPVRTPRVLWSMTWLCVEAMVFHDLARSW